jgi:uncharacterized protein
MTNKPSDTESQAVERTRLAVSRYAAAWLAGNLPALVAC